MAHPHGGDDLWRVAHETGFEGGAIQRPISAMNLAGNHLEFWNKLLGVGDAPYVYSSMRMPTLAFDATVVAGA